MDHAGEHSATEAHLAVGEHSAAEEDLAAAGEHRVVETDLASELGVGEADLTEACEDGAAEANRASREYKDTVANSPVPDSASASPYGYAADSPLDLADPTGHYVTAYSGPLTPAQQKQQAAQQKASISAAAAGGARQAAAAKTAPLDAHQLHLAHLAHLAAIGQAPAKAPVARQAAAVKAAARAIPTYCAGGNIGALNTCMSAVYRAAGGQTDASGVPKGTGYNASIASQAMSVVQKQYNAEQQAASKAAVKKPTATAPKPKDQPYLLPVGARDIFINLGAPDLGNETQKTPVGHPGISIQITPEGDLAPLIFRNTGAPDLGTGKLITPIGDQGRIINAAKGPGGAAQGKAGVDQTIGEIEGAGGRVLGQEIGLSADGWRARVDLYVSLPSGQKAFIEVKTGDDAPWSPNQEAVYPAINARGGKTYGSNAKKAGLPQEIGPTRVYVVYQPWPLGTLGS